MVSLFSRDYLKLYFRHEIPPYITYSLSHPTSSVTRIPLSNPLAVLIGWYKNKNSKKNNFQWSLYSSLFGSQSYLQITLGIALHCQHCMVIAIEHLTLQSTFCIQRINTPPFIPPFLRHNIVCKFSSCCSPTPTVEHCVSMQFVSMPIYKCSTWWSDIT